MKKKFKEKGKKFFFFLGKKKKTQMKFLSGLPLHTGDPWPLGLPADENSRQRRRNDQ